MVPAHRYGRMGEIIPEEEESWRGRVFVTIDIDWAIDQAIDDVLDLLRRAGAVATFFMTHATPAFERMLADGHEVGIHPNLNPTIAGNGPPAEAVLADLHRCVPQARSLRCHSMTQSSRLLDEFTKQGFSHDGNQFLPLRSGIETRPYRHWNGLVRVPYRWEDDVELMYDGHLDTGSAKRAAQAPGLSVLDFHPVHIALNTCDMAHYEATRACHRDWDRLVAARAGGPGVRDCFCALLGLSSAGGD